MRLFFFFQAEDGIRDYKVTGVQTCALPILKVVAGDLTQIDEVRSGDSYISQSDQRLHFGLEQRTKVDLIQVRWPSGNIDKVTGVGVNRVVTIKEGQGKIAEKEFKR